MTTTDCCDRRFLAGTPTIEIEGATVHVRCEREFRVGLAMLRDGSHCVNGVVRWDSNGNVVPSDLAGAVAIVYGAGVLAESARARSAETARFLAEYRASRVGRVRSAEEMFEMRAAFGAGASVVDIITGEVTIV